MKNNSILTSRERYRNSVRPTKVDLKIDERERLDEILKSQNKKLTQWVREHIEEDYKELYK